MKQLKTVVLLSLLALTGCKQSVEVVGAAQAAPADQGKEYYSLYSGASIPDGAR